MLVGDPEKTLERNEIGNWEMFSNGQFFRNLDFCENAVAQSVSAHYEEQKRITSTKRN